MQDLYALAKKHDKRLELCLGFDSQSIDALFVDNNVDEVGCDWIPEYKSKNQFAMSSDPLLHGKKAYLRPVIREYLCNRLPEYMIPSSFVFLEALPLTSNGKIDRKALPVPQAERPELLETYIEPHTETEQILARIFAQILGIDLVGIHDNFFELGGHSLLAVQLMAKVEEQLQIEIPLSVLFEGPTITDVEQYVLNAPGSPIVSHQDRDDVKTLPLSPMDIHFYYGRLYLKKGDNAWYQVMEFVVDSLVERKLTAAILYAVNKHPIARGHFLSDKGWKGKACWDVHKRLESAPLVIHDISSDIEINSLIEVISGDPLAMNVSPTCRFVWIRGGSSDRLLLRYNHCAMDASGLQCLLNSMMSHYLGQSDPVQRVLPFSARELYEYYGYEKKTLIDNNEFPHTDGLLPTGHKRSTVSQSNTSILKSWGLRPAKIHSSGGSSEDKSCSAVELMFSSEETDQLHSMAKSMRSTLDRIFIVGILKGGKAWNRQFTKKTGRIEAHWAVNLRPPKMFDSIVANQFGWARVRASASDQDGDWQKDIIDPSSNFLINGALDWMNLLDTFYNWPIPNFLKRFFFAIGTLGVPSIFISNTLTVTVSEVDRTILAKEFGISHMQNHSKFGTTNRPTVVIGKIDDRLRLRMVYPRSQFDQNGATQFLEMCKKQTLEVQA